MTTNAFRLKGRLYTLTVMQLLTIDEALIAKQLDQMIATAPNLFAATPVVIDVTALHVKEWNVSPLWDALHTRQLSPIGIQGGSEQLNQQARAHGIAVLHASAMHDRSVQKNTKPPPSLGKLVSQPVRSGQQVVSKQDDLVILSSVSQGSELMSHGHIHVYGTLRGRALAGMSGNKEARIFCLALDAELISIAGYYRIREEFDAVPGPCQIYLDNETIQISALS